MVNSLGIKVLAWVNRFSVILHSCGVFSICVALLAKAPTHRTAKQVFDTFNDSTGDPGWSVIASPAYVALTGILLAQFTITGTPHCYSADETVFCRLARREPELTQDSFSGFDASAHMAEETRNAGKAAPKGVIM